MTEKLPAPPAVPTDFAFLVGTEGIGVPTGARRAARAARRAQAAARALALGIDTEGETELPL